MTRMIFMFGVLAAMAAVGCSASTDESERDTSTDTSESDQTSADKASQGSGPKDPTVYRAIMSSAQEQPGGDQSAPGDPIPWNPGTSSEKSSDK
jgi:hypothetical protein